MMWGYGIGCGVGAIWWIGGLFLFIAVVYSAVRLSLGRCHENRYDYHDYESRYRDCHEDDRYRWNDR